jgi:hypothetical protein
MRLIDADKLKQHYNWWNNEEQRTFDQIVDAQPTVGGECIPREWLLKNTNTGMNVIEMMQAIKDAPVIAVPNIDSAPVVHGEWIDGLDIPKEERERHPYVYLHGEKYCSACYKEAYFDTDYGQQFFDYCPNCGAKMDGGDGR